MFQGAEFIKSIALLWARAKAWCFEEASERECERGCELLPCAAGGAFDIVFRNVTDSRQNFRRAAKNVDNFLEGASVQKKSQDVHVSSNAYSE